MATVAGTLALAAVAEPARAQFPAHDSVEVLLADRVRSHGGGGMAASLITSAGAERHVVGEARPGSPLPPDGIFEIGSVSKVLTGLLLADMVGRGEVGLEQPLQSLLPDSVTAPSRDGRRITLLDLATATSGLPRLPGNMAPADPADPYADYDEAKLYAFLSRHELARAPGSAYEYSNLGMGLLGHVLARRLGLAYEEAVRARILEPLGMHETWITVPESQRGRLVQGHDADAHPVPSWTEGVLAGAFAWRSSLADMERLARAAIAPPAGPIGEALRLSMTPQRPTGQPGTSMALAWHVLERDGRTVTWHNGATYGSHSFLGIERDRQEAVILLGNVALGDDDLAIHLLDPAAPLADRPVPMLLPASLLEPLVGRYRLAPGFDLAITREGDRLYVQATGQPRFRLHARAPRRFFLRGVEAEVEFTPAEGEPVTGVILHQAGQHAPGVRVDEPSP